MAESLNLADTAQNPGSKFTIRTQNRTFNAEALPQDEAQLFEQQFNGLINDFADREHMQLFKSREEEIALAATHAKNNFNKKAFGGVNAGDNEISMDVIRPGHIRADPSDGSTINDWYFSPGSSGWNDWIGDGTSSNDKTVGEDALFLVIGFLDQDPTTQVSGFNVERFGRNVNMTPKDLHNAKVPDTQNEILTQALPTMLASENDRIHVRLRHDRDVESQPRLLGVTFGMGHHMNQEDF